MMRHEAIPCMSKPNKGTDLFDAVIFHGFD